MAKLNKIMTLTMAIVFLIEVCASDISTSYNTSSNATLLDRSSTLSCWILHRVMPGPLFGTVFAFGLIGKGILYEQLYDFCSLGINVYPCTRHIDTACLPLGEIKSQFVASTKMTC